ncbi:uncharacterized protein KIAA2012 homolog [Pyxicephalus adspersus]|uniref:uncharacterized protein KIAA2012 homolog n=1 Tax=Pyxicephalus adspersus TaxID=30357 RepID=UPI003B5BCAE0
MVNGLSGSLRDSVQLQQPTNYSGENSGRHPDLSSTPLKYHRLPVFSYLPQWTNTDAFTSPGRCTPVEEETGNEEELGTENEIHEVYGKKLDVPLSGTGNFRKSSSERTKSHVTQSSWKTKEKHNSQLQGEAHLNYINFDDTISSKTDYDEKASVPLEVSFGKDNSSLTGKPHTTFYGGPFTGRRKFPYGKQDLTRLHNENLEHLPEGTFLPPISQSNGPETEVRRENKIQEPLKLPPIMEESSRVPQRKMRRKATDPPKELLVIPLLVHFENKKVTQEEKTSTDESREAEPLNNDKGYISNELQSQDKELADLTLEKEIPTSGADGKIKTLQMDIEWNLDPNPDDELPMSDAPSVSLLPPINRKKGPGHQSSMANLKAPGGSNSNTLGSKSQSLPTGIIRGSIPEELKECCKGGSVGSLIMSPNGEIVCLSLMGAARDTDIPIRFDFIAEEEEEDCLPSESAGQEEQWSGSQQDSEKETDGSDFQSLQIPTNMSVRTASPQHCKEPSQNKSKKKQRKTCVAQTDIEENADDVSDQQSITDVIYEKTHETRDTRREKRKVDSGEKSESNTGTGRESRNMEASSISTPVTMNRQESLDNNTVFSIQDTKTFTGENDLQNDGEGKHSPFLAQTSFQPTHNGSQNLQQDAASLHKSLPIKSTDPVISTMPQTKSDTTKTSPNLEEVQTTNGKPPSGESTRKNPENIPNSKAAAPSTVEDEHSNKQDPTIKGTGKQANTITKDADIVKNESPKESRKSKKTPEINKNVQREANRNKEKQSAPDLQMEQRSPPGKQEMTEDEEMALLQEITNTTKKEVVKEKVKKKSKVEKAQKPEKNQVKAPRKSNQGSATEGKAAFVVGQPKDKKVESKIHYPKSTGKVQRQQTIQETQEKVHEMPTGEENDSEKESEDSYIVSEHLNRSPSPTETKDLTPMSAGECQITSDSVTGTAHKVSGQVSGQDSEQTAPKATSSNLVVTNSTNEDEYALSETSEATSSSFRQKSTRVRELSEKAERRRLEVERKRKEREEQLRLEKEQQERMERMREELEEEQRRREEEIQMRKQREEEERQRQEQERVRRMQLEQQALERARLQQEEYRRKLQEIQKRKQQEELERIALERQRQQEKERLEAEERMRLLEMAADEREEYQRRKQEREEQARQEAERRRLMAEAEAKALMEEAKRQAQLLARQTAALEQQLQFNRGLMKESIGMDQTQGVSRPWVFSYFEFLELLGIPLPVEGEST